MSARKSDSPGTQVAGSEVDNIDAEGELSEDHLDRQLARLQGLPTEHERAGGASRETALVFVVTGLAGMLASIMLLVSEKSRLTDPGASLMCDINPIFGCSKWIGKWQNEVFFGISNSVLGLAFFAGMTALGLVLLSRGTMGRLLWQAASVAASLGIVWVAWFAYQSYVVEGSLCPYCVVTWLATIPLFVILFARSMQAGHWGRAAEPAGRALVRSRWAIIAIVYLALVLFTIIWFWDRWALVF